MKVLLIQQDMGIRETEYPMFPVGLTYIAGALKDHSVKIFDPNVYPLSDAIDQLKRELHRFEPHIVGISIRNIDTTNYRNKHVHFKTVRPMIQLIKDIDPSIRIIVGGSGFSLFAEVIMSRIPEIDFGVYLEGEESTPELLDNLDNPQKVSGIFIRRNSRVFFTGSRSLPDFSEIPTPRVDPDVIDMAKYMGPSYNIIGIQSKRGCALECGYCSYPSLNGTKIRLRDPRVIVDQIEYMIRDFDMKRFVFIDSIFNIPQQHAVDICQEMIKRSLDVEFGVWCHMKGISVEFLQLLKDAGAVQIDFSPDAATNKGLAALQKGLTENDIRRTIRMARRVKEVGVGFSFFASLPDYSFIDVLKTLSMPFRIQLALPGRGGAGIGFVRIEPNTQMYKIAVKEGVVDENDDLLPEDEEDLARMFYRPRSQARLNYLTDVLTGFLERIVKPAAVVIFRALARMRHKAPILDQKTGFVPVQRKLKS